MRSAVIDSSCLICLAHLDLAQKLALYFDVVYVPRHVQIEFNRKHRSRYRLKKLFERGLLQKCMCKDETNFLLLTAQLDAGEAEALVQAQEQCAEFLLADERRAREIAQRQGLISYGTVRILARLSLEGYADDVWKMVRRLKRERGFHVSDEVVARAIAFAETPIGRFSDPPENP
jgi:uncharacterized protein